MTDTAHARMWARTHEVFAEQDAARREQLDRWIREAKDPGYDPTDGLCIRGHPLATQTSGRRYCPECNRIRMKGWRKRKDQQCNQTKETA